MKAAHIILLILIILVLAYIAAKSGAAQSFESLAKLPIVGNMHLPKEDLSMYAPTIIGEPMIPNVGNMYMPKGKAI